MAVGKDRTGRHPTRIRSTAGLVALHPLARVRGTDQDRSVDRANWWSVPRTRLRPKSYPRARH